MKKIASFILLVVLLLACFVPGLAYCQNQAEKWEALRSQASTSSDDLRGRNDWHELSKHPVSFQKTSTTSSSGCYSVATGNNITVTASDGSVVNIEASQSNDGTVNAECNEVDKQENNY